MSFSKWYDTETKVASEILRIHYYTSEYISVTERTILKRNSNLNPLFSNKQRLHIISHKDNRYPVVGEKQRRKPEARRTRLKVENKYAQH